MPGFLFYLFAAITLVFGVLVVTARNPVGSAMSLAVSFCGVAALFISLDAYVIGILQILVYAGAVMVLFLFILMLLDIKAEEVKGGSMGAAIAGVVLASLFALQIAGVLGKFDEGTRPVPSLSLSQAAAKADLPTISNDLAAGTLPDAKLMGETLFDKYPFHLQIVGLLLLAGTVGVVVLSKRDRGENEEAQS